MKAMVAPEYDDGVVLHRGGGIKGIKEAPELVIDVGDTGEVALHEFFPLSVLDHPLVPVSSSVVMSVGQVIFTVGR